MSQSVNKFFQVILPCTLQLGKLEIPPMFVLSFGESVLSSSSIILMAPNGDTWPVALEKNDGSITIGKGWIEFAHHYSVGAMDLITFQYKCSNQESLPVFSVCILKDSTGMEITNYPTKHHHPYSQVNDNHSTGMEITNYPTKHHHPYSQVNDNHESANGSPASFEKCQSILNGKCYMEMPPFFIRKTGLHNEEMLLLKGETGVEWEVKLNKRVRVYQTKTKYKHGAASEYKRYNLGNGWMAFRRDNRISNTDKLKFHHIHGRLIAVTKVV